MSIKINKLEIENTKRVKAVTMEPTASGLTVIGGKNGQGKTSVLDAIAWALGGDKFKPSEPRRDGSVTPPALHVELSNGLVVERKGKNGDLKVIDPAGNKAGQQLLNEFVGAFALDLPRFMSSSSKEKSDTLLQVIGVGDKLYELEQQEKTLYNQRHSIGIIADQKKKYAEELEVYPDAPSEPVSASELIQRQQVILAKNGENHRHRQNLQGLERQLEDKKAEYARIQQQIDDLMLKRGEIGSFINTAEDNLIVARKTVEQLQDESTAELESSIAEIDEINRKVRTNMDRAKAEQEAADYGQQYEDFTIKINEIRKQKSDLLQGARLPLPGLSVEDGELLYKGYRWDNMSGADQLRVATAIVRALNPNCGFVLLDGLEAMDIDTLKDFGGWLEGEDMQAIATRVSTGGECSIIISDGYAISTEAPEIKPVSAWKAGEF